MSDQVWAVDGEIAEIQFQLVQQVKGAHNPGYLARMERRAEKQNNSSLYWKPGDSLPASPPDFGKAFGQ